MELDADKMTLSNLLTRTVYVVPHFQRDYSWNEVNWEFLWADIRSAMKENSDHFMGSVLVTKDFVDEKVPSSTKLEKTAIRYLIDGQQRIVTLLLLISALADQLAKDFGEADHKEAHEELFRHLKAGPKFKHGGHAIARLTMNDAPAQERLAFLLGLGDEPKLVKRAQIARMMNAKAYFADRIEEYQAKGGSPVGLVETLLDRLQFIHLETGSDSDAFAIFESLNARGESLLVTDLVKNLVMGRARRLMTLKSAYKGLDKEIDENWSAVAQTIREGVSDRLRMFLRHFWIAEHGFVRETELYREVSMFVRPEGSTPVQSAKVLRSFSSGLKDAAAQYAWLWSGDNDASFDPGAAFERARPRLAGIKAFNATQVLPVLLAALRSGVKAVDFESLTEAAESAVIRRSLASQPPNEIEKETGRWCEQLRKQEGAPAAVKSIVSELRILAGRNQTDKTFALASVSSERARHLLLSLENRRRASAHKEIFSFDEVDVEHILPKTVNEKDWPAGAWGGAEQQAELTSRLGNYALWASAANRSLKNARYDCGKPTPNAVKVTCCKRHAYENSDVLLTSEIATKYRDWTPAALNARQEELARGAEKVWPYSKAT